VSRPGPAPDEPSEQQRQWLDRLERARGTEYARAFATVLRLAHGKVFPVVAQVRASTRNSLVRELADDANTTVLDHIEALEATGCVGFDAVARDVADAGTPPATGPGPAAPPPSSPSSPSPPSPEYTLPPPAYSPPPS
jgi:hypothetical protein